MEFFGIRMLVILQQQSRRLSQFIVEITVNSISKAVIIALLQISSLDYLQNYVNM